MKILKSIAFIIGGCFTLLLIAIACYVLWLPALLFAGGVAIIAAMEYFWDTTKEWLRKFSAPDN